MGWVIGHGNSFIFRQGGGQKWQTYWLTRFVSAPTLTVDSSTQMTLGWTNNGDGAYDDIRVERSSDGSTWAETTVAKGETSLVVTSLTAYTLYGFRIRYRKGSSHSAYTDVVFNFTNPVDGDGNEYEIVNVGGLKFFGKDLKTTKYADGSDIPNVTVNATWLGLTSGAYCWHNNNVANKDVYGGLYNCYAFENAAGLVPEGCTIPSRKQIQMLEEYFLGGNAVAGGKLKEVGTTHWTAPNTGASDDYNFTALPGGSRDGEINGAFASNVGTQYIPWTKTAHDATQQYLFYFTHDAANSYSQYYNKKKYGHQIRALALKASGFNMTDHSETALNAMRTTIIDRIWPGGYPTDGIDSIATGVAEPMASSASNLASIDQATLIITGIANRTPYIWHPASPNGKFVLWHMDHFYPATGTDIWEQAGVGEAIRALIEEGFTVAGIYMPPANNGVEGNVHSLASISDPFTTVDDLHLFLDSTIRLINEYESSYDEFYMAGLSGGGWTTTIMAALDTRISKSAPTAGTLPLVATEHSGQARDWEQQLPGLYDLVEYGDLYAMGCTGGRKQTQYLNENEGDANKGFNLIHYNHCPYEPQMKMICGDDWKLDWDTVTTSHEVTAATLAKIITFFNS